MGKRTCHESVDIYASIKIKLIPGSSKNQFAGKEDDFYRVKVTALPIEGRANRALISMLSKKLKRPKGDIEIISGKTSRIKLLRLRGIDKESVVGLMEAD